ncbi:MAG TPA: hypothetical protein ENK18_23180 [Deltaproteobacteria bacterium]|nr:hypothetical protein [Deltaproteobacteria bacterium]
MNLALALGLIGVSAAQQPPEQVTMTLDDFLELYEASRERPDKPAPPRQFALSSARYDGTVVLDHGEPASAVFQARFRIENLRDRGFWIRVPLLPASVAVRSARLGGSDAPLVLEGGYYTLVTDRQDAFEVNIEFAAAVVTRDGSSGFDFPVMGSGATDLRLSVPGSDALDFSIANAKLKSDRRVGDTRVVEATLPATGSLSVWWQREIPEVEAADARVYAEVHTLVGVGEGLLTARATLQETILFSGIDRVSAQIPSGMTVLDVRGAGLRDWSIDEQGTLTALLNYAAEGSYVLTLDLERVLEDGAEVTVPLVAPVEVERSKGFVGVQPLSNVELTSGPVTGAAMVDVRTLPASILGVTGQPVLLGYKYLGTGAKIPLSVTEHEEVDVLVTLLDQAEATTMFTADGRRLTSVRYQVRNNRRQFLRLSLPEGATLWSASVGGRSVQPAISEDGQLLVPLVRSQASGGSLAAFGVEVVYVETGDPPRGNGTGRFEGRLPVADAPTTWVGWTVYAPDRAKIKRRAGEGSLRRVPGLSRPATAAAVYNVPAEQLQMTQAATGQAMGGSLGEGAAPVEVSLPVDGQPLYFEKLLALDEPLWVSFDYRGLK